MNHQSQAIMSPITINGNTIDPSAQGSDIRTRSFFAADASKSNFILIQTRAPLSDEQEQELNDIDAEVQEYISDNTYLCHYPPPDLTVIREKPWVTWANTYMQDFKIVSSLKPEGRAGAATNLMVREIPAIRATPLRNSQEVDIVFHCGVDINSEAIRTAIKNAAHINDDGIEISGDTIRTSVQDRYLTDLAEIDEIKSIAKVFKKQLRNNVARKIIGAEVVINNTEYKGTDQVVCVADTGFDNGTKDRSHPAFKDRIAELYNLGHRSSADDPDGHGTHVCGSVLGDGFSETMGGVIQGTAPEATLVMQSVGDNRGSLIGIPNDLKNLFGPPYEKNNARIHTNSWGSSEEIPRQLPYDTSSTAIDEFVWKQQDMVICFAAGNDGIDKNRDGVIDPRQIGSEAAAKNCITVGASENGRGDLGATYGELLGSGGQAPPIRNDKMANNPEGMVAFSSRGPTIEHRQKPDIVAPGTSILSTRSSKAPWPPGRSEFFWGKSTDRQWFFDAGTSMACPLVAGCCAVLRETLVKNGTANPSAALIKAMLINGATALKGQYATTDAGAVPNSIQGFGRINLKNSVIIPGQTGNAGFYQGGPLGRQKQDSKDLEILEGEKDSLRITLVYSDPPGNNLQNSLNLIIKAADGTEHHGNKGDSDEFDDVNNVEQIIWKGVPKGIAKVIVVATKLAKMSQPQPFAYAWRFE